MPIKLSITCPACNRPLNAEIASADLDWSVWCGNGKCSNKIAEDGEDAETAEIAANILVKRVEDWLEANETY